MIDINLNMEDRQIQFLDADGVSKRTATFVKEIGGGATSIVYTAKLDDGKLAVLKLYRETDSRTRNYDSELAALRLFSQLPDPSNPITPIFLGNSDESKDSARFVVMELISTPSLEALIADGLLNEKDACMLGIQLFKFMQLLHKNKKSYPDIKKENFRWGEARLRVIDIGGLFDAPAAEMIRRDLFEIGLVFLNQCIPNMPDLDHMLSRISGQPVAQVLSNAQPPLSAGLKYIFSRLFHDDYDYRYQSADEVVSDLEILQKAHDETARELCKKLDSQIKELEKSLLKAGIRWQKKKEIFIIAGVLDLFHDKDTKVSAILKEAGKAYSQAALEEGIEKFKSSPSRAKSLFQEIINGEDWGMQPGSKDKAWRWYWACLVAYPDTGVRGKLESLLEDVDRTPDNSSELIAKPLPINDPAYDHIQSQIQFLDSLKKKNLDDAEKYLELLPKEYQESRRGELEGLREGMARQGELSGLLIKIRDGSTDASEVADIILEARQKLASIDSAEQWWAAIKTAAENLIARKEFNRAESVLQAGFTYPGYPLQLTEYLETTRSLTMIQMDLALGDVVRAATSWLKLAESRENLAEVFKQPILNFRIEIYQLGNLVACDILEKGFVPNWISDTENQKWENVKVGMQAALKVNKEAVGRLFDKLTSDKPVLGENMDFPVRLLIQDHLETEQEINYKKALLRDAFRQLNDDTLKDRLAEGLEALESARQKAGQVNTNHDVAKKEIKNNLDSYEKEFKRGAKDISPESVEDRREKIIALMFSIYQVLRDENDVEMQNAMRRALVLSEADITHIEMMNLLTEIKKRSTLKKNLTLFASGKLDEAKMRDQLLKEIFRDKNEYQRYVDCINHLLILRESVDGYKENGSVKDKWDWVESLRKQEFHLPKEIWEMNLVRVYLKQITNDIIKKDLRTLTGVERKKNLLLAIFADKTIKEFDNKRTLPDEYMEGRS